MKGWESFDFDAYMARFEKREETVKVIKKAAKKVKEKKLVNEAQADMALLLSKLPSQLVMLLDAKDIKMCSINEKYLSKTFVLTKKYRDFKKEVEKMVKKNTKNIELPKPPYKLEIWVKTYKDIDAFVKPLQDAIQCVLGDDNQIIESHTLKQTGKRGGKENLMVFIGHCDPIKIWED